MDDIEKMIMTIITESDKPGMEVAEVTREIQSRYGHTYPTKRIKHKMDTLTNFKYLSVRQYRFEKMKGPSRSLYSLYVEGAQ